MKYNVLIVIIFLLCICLSTAFAVNSDTSEFKIAVASDLHMQEAKEDRIEANPLMFYQSQIVSAFASEIIDSNVDLLILSGDITNQGRLVQHDLLLDLVREIEAGGVSVCVLPGNHDIGQVTPELFAEIYSDFGYADSFSRDEHSLSYSLLIHDHLVLMLDTNGYSGNHLKAFLAEPTLKWMEQQLSLAQKYAYPVIVVGHFPMVTSHVTPFEGKEDALRLLLDYDIPLYICGHMHLRNVAQYRSLAELCVDQLVSYPCAYALVTMTDHQITYIPQRVDVETWAANNGVDDPRILNFNDFSTALTDRSLDFTLNALIGEQRISDTDKQLMFDFFYLFRREMAQGTLFRTKDAVKQHPGYNIFMKYAAGTSYGRWVPTVFETVTPYTNGFILQNANISPLPAD